MKRALLRGVFGWLAVLLLAGLLPQAASAHASLIKAVPEPNSQLDQAPEQIQLTFNERLEAELYYIKVFDELGRPAFDGKAALSPDQRTVTLSVPGLDDGRYIVTYHVISADGHPVEGSYVLIVGKPSEGAAVGPEVSLHYGHELSADMSLTDILKYAMRVVYYFTLLAAAGWIFWGIAVRTQPADVSRFYWDGALTLQRIHLIALLGFIYFHYKDLLGDEGTGQLAALFTGTWVGRSWLLLLLLSLAGFAVVRRSKAMAAAWFALLLAAKSLSSHAMGYEPQWATLPANFIHLAAAAVWAGGLLLIVSAWKKHRGWLETFLPQFSRGALLSLALLALTGLATVLIYLPSPKYLLYSQWGKLLIAKTAFVLIVILMGAGIRQAMKKRKEKDLRDMVRMDAAAMLIIVVLVGLMTYISPVPPNEPLYWHEMGETVHMTVKISPNVPGDNQFHVDAWLPEKNGKPKEVELLLTPKEQPDIAPISVPLKEVPVEQEGEEFTGEDRYKKYSYEAEGSYLPFAGLWHLEFRLRDAGDDTTVYEYEYRVY